MDQIKPILEQMKRHHFWILIGIVTLATLAVGYVSSSRMAQEREERISQIDRDFQTVQRIQSTPNHPNEKTAQGMEQVNKVMAQMVLSAWRERLARQESILVWPQELKQDFIAKVKPLQPIESTVPYPEHAGFKGLNRAVRSRYRDYIKNELPKLAQRIKAPWHPGSSSSVGQGNGGDNNTPMGGAAPGGDGGGSFSFGGPAAGSGQNTTQSASPAEEEVYVVEWASSDQTKLEGRFVWASGNGVPGVLDILYAQEDLWVLQSLMEVVAKTNGDADAQYNAAIKELLSIDLGAEAGGITGGGTPVAAPRGGGMGGTGGMPGGGMPGGGGGMPGGGMPGGGGGMPGGGMPGGMGGGMMGNRGGGQSRDPADNRYVDGKYNPISGSKLRGAFQSNSPEDAFLVVAKRMPVRMRVKMNVLRLPRFLVECGNAKLTFEIRQVRINPKGAGSSGGGGAGGGSGPVGKGGMGLGLGSGSPGGGLGGDSGASSQSSPKDQTSPYDATVEVYGLIYIYNPPVSEKLGLDKDEAAGRQASTAAVPSGAGG